MGACIDYHFPFFAGATNKKYGRQEDGFFISRIGRWLTEAKDKRKLKREMEYESPHWIHLHNTHWIHLIDHVAVRQEKQRRRKRILIVFWRSSFHTVSINKQYATVDINVHNDLQTRIPSIPCNFNTFLGLFRYLKMVCINFA